MKRRIERFVSFVYKMVGKSIIFLIIITLGVSCQSDTSEDANSQSALFTKVEKERSNLDFENQITDQENFNVLTYRNYYNGGGVAIGDINNDDLPDLFFTANMNPNQLFLNKGDLTFENITESAGVSGTMSWSTGVTMADVNGDGLQDIYVCNSGDVEGSNKVNELFINNGDNTFVESAKEYGLDDHGFSTHASFFDYDRDGDLDVYILNNSFKDPSRIDFKNVRHIRNAEGGDKLFRNEGSIFVDVSEEAGIYGSRIGFGLGVSVSDMNGDYMPDIYVSNDFWERDYLYLNTGNGRFEEVLPDRISLTSTASMGADVADLDNNGTYDLISTDMLPATNKRLKTNTIYNEYHLEDLKYRIDYHFQHTQNCLQINDGTATFTEQAYMSGVAATDWSWAALIFDFDNDGWKDIFISNGVYHDITDMDYSEFIEDNEAVKEVVEEKGRFDFRDFLEFLPSNKLANYAFINNRDLTFTNKSLELGLGDPGFSNGSAYGDLDNDGDLDLVVNNVNSLASLYENSSSQLGQNNFIKLHFKGAAKNVFGIGAVVEITTAQGNSFYQNYQSRGFQSSTEPVMTIGIGSADVISTLKVVWPSGKIQTLNDLKSNTNIILKEEDAMYIESPENEDSKPLFVIANDIFTDSPPQHQENLFNDFDYERLLTHMISNEGPELLTGDITGDGLDDFVLLGAEDDPDKIFVQSPSGKFSRKVQKDLELDAKYESVSGTLTDFDNDGDLDMIIVNGGNDPRKSFQSYLVRTYKNDGKGVYLRQLIPGFDVIGNMSCIQELEMRGGQQAYFIGGRVVPGNYGLIPRNYLMMSNVNNFVDVTSQETGQVGMITDAVAVDIDGDGDEDLAVVGEWMPLTLYENTESGFKLKGTLTNSSGLWQTISTADINNDGKMDLIGGNWGTNSKLQASAEKPLSILVNDFDQNKKTEFIITWYAPDDEEASLFASKRDLTNQLPHLKKRVLKNHEYAESSVEDLIDKEIIDQSLSRKVNNLKSGIFLNQDEFSFSFLELPPEGQLSPLFSILPIDINKDGNIDLIAGGNLYALKPDIGRMDSSLGAVFLGDGSGNFKTLNRLKSGLTIKGEVRDIKAIKTATGKELIFVARNNKDVQVYEINN